VEISELRWKRGYIFQARYRCEGEQNYLSVFLFCTEFSQDTFVFVELSHDTITFLTDDVSFSMLQNYLGILQFCDRIFARACHKPKMAPRQYKNLMNQLDMVIIYISWWSEGVWKSPAVILRLKGARQH
jgi:hypothetical protein